MSDNRFAPRPDTAHLLKAPPQRLVTPRPRWAGALVVAFFAALALAIVAAVAIATAPKLY